MADGIEDPRNAAALVACAGMFGTRCFFRGRFEGATTGFGPDGGSMRAGASLEAIRPEYALILALATETGRRTSCGIGHPRTGGSRWSWATSGAASAGRYGG